MPNHSHGDFQAISLDQIPSLPVFNQAVVKELRVEQPYLIGIFKVYWELAEREIGELEFAFSRMDSARICQISHLLKDTSNKVGGEQISALADWLELSIHQGETVDARAVVELLEDSLQRFKDAVRDSPLCATH